MLHLTFRSATGGASSPQALAASLFRELRRANFTAVEVLAVWSHLIGLVTEDLKQQVEQERRENSGVEVDPCPPSEETK